MSDRLIYAILLFSSYLGIVAGAAIAHFSREELKSGRRYFRIAKLLLFSSVFGVFLYGIGLSPLLSLIFSAIMLIIVFKFEGMYRHVNTNVFYYGFFAVALFEALAMRPVISTLVFFFGVVEASISYKKNVLENIINMLIDNIIYIALGLVLAAGFYYI